MQNLQVAAFLGAAVLLPAGVILLGLGLRGPRPAAIGGTAPAPGGPVPHPVRELVAADHHSTYIERRECRTRLGSKYDAQLVVVADNLARRPAALRGIAMEPNDLPIDDLVTVSLYLQGPPIGLDRALRNGVAESYRAVVACLTSGLRRFPFHHGACYGVARAVGVPLDVYLAGRTVLEPAFIRAQKHWSPAWSNALAGDDTEIVFAFWSRTGRQVGALGGGPGTVMFATGTRFRVLGVRSAAAGDGPSVVCLREHRKPARPAWVPGRRPGSDLSLARSGLGQRRILARLLRPITVKAARTAGPARSQALTSNSTALTSSPGSPDQALPVLEFTPGFDETGRPYREEPGQPRPN